MHVDEARQHKPAVEVDDGHAVPPVQQARRCDGGDLALLEKDIRAAETVADMVQGAVGDGARHGGIGQQDAAGCGNFGHGIGHQVRSLA